MQVSWLINTIVMYAIKQFVDLVHTETFTLKSGYIIHIILDAEGTIDERHYSLLTTPYVSNGI